VRFGYSRIIRYFVRREYMHVIRRSPRVVRESIIICPSSALNAWTTTKIDIRRTCFLLSADVRLNGGGGGVCYFLATRFSRNVRVIFRPFFRCVCQAKFHGKRPRPLRAAELK